MARTYRADIDGLRAVSVVAVVLYHFEVPPFSGGFVGVDVFFVISGFLITSILWAELRDGRFSLLGFYDRRIRRILPAALVVVVVSLLAGFVLLLPGDLESLGRQSATALLGVINFFLVGNTGYFDQDASLLPLLHFWSLAVEDQFYLIWPLCLAGLVAVAAKTPARTVVAALVAIICVSLAISIWLSERSPAVAFYMLHSRAWELAIGALLVFAPVVSQRMLGEIASALGLGLIAFAVFALSVNDPFPGVNALYPCIGAALIVWPKAHETWISRLLSFEPVRQIGLASFSLYLWHWPVLVYFRHWNNGLMPSAFETSVLIAFSVAVAFFSLIYIEQPFRKTRVRSARRTIAAGGAAIALALFPAVAAAAAHGFPSRLPPPAQKLAGLKTMWAWECPHWRSFAGAGRRLCVFGEDWDAASTRVLLWGDSHAQHYAPIVQASADRHSGISVALYPGCAPALGGNVHHVSRADERTREACAAHYRRVVGLLSETHDISIVLLAGAWAGLLPDLYAESVDERGSAESGAKLLRRAVGELLATISMPGRDVYVLGDFPRWPSDGSIACAVGSLSNLPRREKCSKANMAIARADYLARHGASNAALMKAVRDGSGHYLSPADALCEGTSCRSWINGEFIYRDAHHIRRNLSRETLEELARLSEIDGIFANRALSRR